MSDTSVETRLLTEDQAATQLLITKRRLQELCRDGQIGFVPITPRVRGFTAEQISTYIESTMVQPKKAGKTVLRIAGVES